MPKLSLCNCYRLSSSYAEYTEVHVHFFNFLKVDSMNNVDEVLKVRNSTLGGDWGGLIDQQTVFFKAMTIPQQLWWLEKRQGEALA